jgi:hypothetical protein
MSLATFALYRARLAHCFELSLEPRNSFLHAAAINLQLRFARAARADPSSLPGQVVPHSGKARQKILQLSQLNLQSTFPAARSLRKDIKNQLRSIENLARE